MFQVPANRIGFFSGQLSLAQLKILQEVDTRLLFLHHLPSLYAQTLSWNFLWAGLCLLGAVYFIFH